MTTYYDGPQAEVWTKDDKVLAAVGDFVEGAALLSASEARAVAAALVAAADELEDK